jgi:hypothetical protein
MNKRLYWVVIGVTVLVLHTGAKTSYAQTPRPWKSAPILVADALPTREGTNKDAEQCYSPPPGYHFVPGSWTPVSTQDSQNEGVPAENEKGIRVDGPTLCLHLTAKPTRKMLHATIKGYVSANIARD